MSSAAVCDPVCVSNGALALLEESDPSLREYALNLLAANVDSAWSMIANEIEKLEELFEDDSAADRNVIALIISKVYYHLGELHDALTYALACGEKLWSLPDTQSNEEYYQTMIGQAIDRYAESRRLDSEEMTDADFEKKLETVVNREFERAFESSQYKYAVGVALETHRLDALEDAVRKCPTEEQRHELLEYTFRMCCEFAHSLGSRNAREAVFELIIRLYTDQSIARRRNEEILLMSRMFLDEHESVASQISGLAREAEDVASKKLARALQMAFDIVDTAPQEFVVRVRNALPAREAGPERSDTDKRLDLVRDILSGRPTVDLNMQFLFKANRADREVMNALQKTADERSSMMHQAVSSAHGFMYCGTTDDSFLTDNMQWLGRAQRWAEFTAAGSLGVTHRGHLTHSRRILRRYLPDSTGAGSEAQADPFLEGGACYALGLIHSADACANEDVETRQFLLNVLQRQQIGHQLDHVVQHGVCLALGLTSMGSCDEGVLNTIREVLMSDDAEAGEAAGIAMGLVQAGKGVAYNDTAAEILEECRNYAHDTEHEKIIRSIAVGLAISMCGREEEADPLITELLAEKDALLRYGGVFMIGLAFAGTANNSALRRLLHVAVSDMSDDVRRAAVMNIGFVLFRESPGQCPQVVRLLAESFNPHVRYGAAMAVGIACAGSAHAGALDLLFPMMDDKSDMVRQGVYLALAMVLIQATEIHEPRVKEFREKLEAKLADRHEPLLAKFGAILATGILDAGGRNCTIELYRARSQTRLLLPAVTGMCVFLQYWYWYPFLHFFSLTLSPTAFIGVTVDTESGALRLPNVALKLENATKKGLYDYPEPLKTHTEKEAPKAPTAILSTTGRVALRKRQKRKEQKEKQEAEKMEVDELKKQRKEIEEAGKSHKPTIVAVTDSESGSSIRTDVSSEGDGKSVQFAEGGSGSKDDKEEDEEKKTPTETVYSNPCRILPHQERAMSYPSTPETKYMPAVKRLRGILVMHDAKPDLPADLVEEIVPKISSAPGAEDPEPEAEQEPSPPADFEWP